MGSVKMIKIKLDFEPFISVSFEKKFEVCYHYFMSFWLDHVDSAQFFIFFGFEKPHFPEKRILWVQVSE
jgi:hypothetical protein